MNEIADEVEIMELKLAKFKLWMERYCRHWQFHLVCFLACNAQKITVAEGNEFVIVAMECEGGKILWSPGVGFSPDSKDVIIGILWENFDGGTL